MLKLWHAIRQTDKLQTSTSIILKLIDEKRQFGHYINILEEHMILILNQITEFEQERDYLDARLAEFERLAERFVMFEIPDHMCRLEFVHLLNGGKLEE